MQYRQIYNGVNLGALQTVYVFWSPPVGANRPQAWVRGNNTKVSATLVERWRKWWRRNRFGMSAIFIVFVCTRLLCGCIRSTDSRATPLDLELRSEVDQVRRSSPE
ncbi:hypothetical protein B296_00024980 [Ensete ventricosum]|uniref:Uncharacterized protein n=1 Tax=Ensete ventricosum TaxID=4639 RepID=A0A426YBK4_ENSVE|nr:hypothetical protein B296_00024980 [Ensete ventricosum]